MHLPVNLIGQKTYFLFNVCEICKGFLKVLRESLCKGSWLKVDKQVKVSSMRLFVFAKMAPSFGEVCVLVWADDWAQ